MTNPSASVEQEFYKRAKRAMNFAALPAIVRKEAEMRIVHELEEVAKAEAPASQRLSEEQVKLISEMVAYRHKLVSAVESLLRTARQDEQSKSWYIPSHDPSLNERIIEVREVLYETAIPAALGAVEGKGERCPTCDSPAPHLHPAVQHEGEVQPCKDPWHAPSVGSEAAPPTYSKDWLAGYNQGCSDGAETGIRKGIKAALEEAAQVADEHALSAKNEANRAHYDHADEESANAYLAEAETAESTAAAIRAIDPEVVAQRVEKGAK